LNQIHGFGNQIHVFANLFSNSSNLFNFTFFIADIETIMNSEESSPLLQIFGDFLHQRPLPKLESEYPILLHKFGDAKIKGTGLSKLEGNCEFWKDLTNPKPPNPKSQPP
jgi:hypothetical protein